MNIPLIQYDYYPYKNGKFGHIGRKSYENEGKDWGDASTSQGLQAIAKKPPEAR